MNTYIALLKGINVGGRNKLPMNELVEILKGMGFHLIRTYIQSGNVVFQSEDQDIVEISGRISAGIKKSHGFFPKTLILKVRRT